MPRRFIVRPLAEADLEHAARWYDEEQTGLGSRFLSAVDQVFGRIRESPQQFPVVSGDIRRALVHTFPCGLLPRDGGICRRARGAASQKESQDMASQSSLVGAFGVWRGSSNVASLRL